MKKVEHPEIIQKILDGQKLEEDELQEAVYEFDAYQFETIAGGDSRWSRYMTTILKIEDRYFRVNWDEGLTEYQEDSFFDQFEEVVLTQTEKTIIVNTYTKI